MKFRSILFLSVISFIFSCKKEETKPQLSERSKLLISRNWVMTSAVISPAFDFKGTGNPSSDAFAHMAPCVKDDILDFSESGKLLIEEGTYKCHPDNLQQRTTAWNFNQNETQISFESQTYNLIKLNEDSLVLSFTVNSNGIDYTRSYFYTAM